MTFRKPGERTECNLPKYTKDGVVHMKTPRYSIITVCYNAEKYIEDTVRSVLMQSCSDYEYIIKDGCSTDHTMEIVHKLCGNNEKVTLIESRDEGIYDAMNAAVLSAGGEYVFFLNAGDKFTDSGVLARTDEFIGCHEADIFYGDVIGVGNRKRYLRKYTEKNSKMWYYSLGACLCHQGMFCDRKLFLEKNFDISYRVCADREWQLYHLSRGKKAAAMKIPVTEILEEGFSSEHVVDLEKETGQCVRLYCGKWYILYRGIRLIKKNRVAHRLLNRVERQISCT